MSLREAIGISDYQDDEYGEIEFSVRRLYFMKQGRFDRDDKGISLSED